MSASDSLLLQNAPTEPQGSSLGADYSWLAGLTEAELEAMLEALPDEDAATWLYDWPQWARPMARRPDGTFTGQLPPPGAWTVWMILAGRGYGKTRTGAEWVRDQVENHGVMRIALVGRTVADVRDTMVKGESGLLSVCPPWNRPTYVPSLREVRWPNGAIATTYTAEKPDQLRGPQSEIAWVDELAAWGHDLEAWSNLMFGLRLGPHPRVCVTTTPRPRPLIKQLMKAPGSAITTGTTYENMANLAASFDAVIASYEGTRLGRQELLAEILDDNPGALWKREWLEELRLTRVPAGVTLERVCVAIDPAATSAEGSDETGIVVAARGSDGHGYVLADRSLRGSPHAWASAAVAAFDQFRADRVVAEVNQGGEMVEFTVRAVRPSIAYKAVHAARGKATRAEPVAALYEQRLVHHVGFFPQLEDQMVNWSPGEKSPDRMDALVWALSWLMVGKGATRGSVPAMAVSRTNRARWEQVVEEAEANHAALERADHVDANAVREAEHSTRMANVLRQLHGMAFLGGR